MVCRGTAYFKIKDAFDVCRFLDVLRERHRKDTKIKWSVHLNDMIKIEYEYEVPNY